MARKKAAGDGTHGPDHSGSICEALCEVAQERHDRCGSDCRGSLVQEPCTDGADHTFFASRSFSAALSSMASAKSFFSRAFSLSTPFRRLASETSSPPYLAFQL